MKILTECAAVYQQDVGSIGHTLGARMFKVAFSICVHSSCANVAFQ